MFDKTKSYWETWSSHCRLPALYPEAVKEWLVVLHNGEWLSWLLVDRPFYSGIIVGLVLSVMLVRFSTASIPRLNRRTGQTP
jgi:hypothetical protein